MTKFVPVKIYSLETGERLDNPEELASLGRQIASQGHPIGTPMQARLRYSIEPEAMSYLASGTWGNPVQWNIADVVMYDYVEIFVAGILVFSMPLQHKITAGPGDTIKVFPQLSFSQLD